MFKIHHMKKVMEYLIVFRGYFKARNMLVMKFKQLFLLLKTSFKLPLK